MEKKYLYRFHWDYGSMGSVESLFIATEDEIESSIGSDLYFGEILGKHSEVYGSLKKEDIEKINLDSSTVKEVIEHLGYTWVGHNPLNHIRVECESCGNSTPIEDFNKSINICHYCESKNKM